MKWGWFLEYGGWLIVIIVVITLMIEINAFTQLDTSGIVAENLKYIKFNFIKDLVILSLIAILGVAYQLKEQ